MDRWDITGVRIMKRKLFFAFVTVAMACTFTACDEDFAEGFREGWNSTTPSDWHYAPAYDETGVADVTLDMGTDEL